MQKTRKRPRHFTFWGNPHRTRIFYSVHGPEKKGMKKIIFTTSFWCLLVLSAFALASVTLCWDSSTDPDVTAYNVYWGGAPGTYTNHVSVTSAFTNAATITELTEGATYYFAATAKDILGLESDFSNEVVYTVPFGCSIIFGNLIQTYSGTNITPTLTTSPPNLSVTLTYNQSTNAPIKSGLYIVIATVSSGNYWGCATNTLKIIASLPSAFSVKVSEQ